MGKGPGCSELLQCCGLSCPGAGHLSLALLSPRANLVCFPAVLYKPSSSQTSVGTEHLHRGWSWGYSTLSSPGCSCPAQGAWHSPGSHWQRFLRERETSSNHFWLISGNLLPVRFALCPQHQGNAMLNVASPEQGEKQSTELLEHGNSVQPGDTECPSSCGAVQCSLGRIWLWGKALEEQPSSCHTNPTKLRRSGGTALPGPGCSSGSAAPAHSQT